jgi:hypothetical protein
MIYNEEVKDLFSVPEDYYFVQCISADFGMGKGIAVEFNKRFDTKMQLCTKCPNYWNTWKLYKMIGDCILEGRVYNLITKERYFHKPTYISMQIALEALRDKCRYFKTKKLAMPLIGCGLDKLEWQKVSEMIQNTFKNEDVEILVCKQ